MRYDEDVHHPEFIINQFWAPDHITLSSKDYDRYYHLEVMAKGKQQLDLNSILRQHTVFPGHFVVCLSSGYNFAWSSELQKFRVTQFYRLTLKKLKVDPPYWQPYLIDVCLAKSSAFLMGAVILVIVRNAAKFAVYDDMRISVKNHQTPAIIRVELALGASSQPEV